MVPTEPEAKLTSPVTGSGQGSGASNGLTHPETTVSEEIEGEKLGPPSFSSSSSTSSSANAFDLDTNETSESKTNTGDISSPAEHDNEDIPVSYMPSLDQEHHDFPTHNEPMLDLDNGPAATTQSPPTQFIDERPLADQTTPSVCRIPSHVFSRTKSTTPIDWSVASNESLFSIQAESMSFSSYQLTWEGDSGRLGLATEISIITSPLCHAMHSGSLVDVQGDKPPSNLPQTAEIGLQNSHVKESLSAEISIMSHPLSNATNSGPLAELQEGNPPSNQPPITKPTEIGPQNTHANESFGANESNASQIAGEVIGENEELNQKKAFACGSVHSANSASLSCRNSDDSGSSIKSFAFPILARDDKSDSLSLKWHPFQRQQSRSRSPKVVQLHFQEPLPQIRKQKPTPRVTRNAAAVFRWSSCFSHCRCRFCC